MRKILILSLASVGTISLLFFSLPSASAVEQISVSEVEDKSDTTILANGDAEVKEVATMSATAFANFRQKYPVLSTFIRVFKPDNMPSQMEDVDIKLDEGKNQVIMEYTLKGVAVNRGDYWEINYFITEGVNKVSLSAQNKNILVFNVAGQITQEMREMTTITVKLPDKASEVNFNSDSKKITYKLPGKMITGNITFLILAVVFFVVGFLSFFLFKTKGKI